MSSSSSPLLVSLMEHNVKATVVDSDHHRVHAGLSVETDYIISVEPCTGAFEAFRISKTYSSFRHLASQLKKASSDRAMVQFAQSIDSLIEGQKTSYLGKVNYNYVKSLAAQRAQILGHVLQEVVTSFPQSLESSSSAKAVAGLLETFFLTDHVEKVDEQGSPSSADSGRLLDRIFYYTTPMKPKKSTTGFMSVPESTTTTPESVTTDESPAAVIMTSPVVPITRKSRRSIMERTQDEAHLSKVGQTLVLDDSNKRTTSNNTFQSSSNILGDAMDHHPFTALAIFVAILIGLKIAGNFSMTWNVDVMILYGFAFFCVGLHMPRSSQTAAPSQSSYNTTPLQGISNLERSASFMLRRSLIASPTAHMNDDGNAFFEHDKEELNEEIKSPLDEFPADADLGSVLNCWSTPSAETFLVRGPHYLDDRRKVPSGDFLFPARGVDLFLTDQCPENVGSNSGILGGALRDTPSLIINFRLPWGVLLFYFEIPKRFLPFIRKRYEFDFEGALPDLAGMTPSERCVARFLQADQETKNKTLKIVPSVIEGPWICKTVVGGKPAIIGNKLPVNWVYEPAVEGEGKAMYLEADLDIVSSSAARGILSTVRGHTSVLTLDLGFVVQANEEDELPEQMLVGVRCHGIDPLEASPLPPMRNAFLQHVMDGASSEIGTAGSSSTVQ